MMRKTHSKASWVYSGYILLKIVVILPDKITLIFFKIKSLSPNQDLQKMFILMMFTKEREPVNYLAGIMKKNGQDQVAEHLLEFSKSEKFIEYVTDEYLEVLHSDVLRSADSCRFPMEASPRGYLLIVLNEPELEPQVKQLVSVFTQMYFKIDVKVDQTAEEIEELFSNINDNDEFQDYNALITILIGHGFNGHFMGTDGPVSIPELIDRCAEYSSGSNFFEDKPKVHIFDCCRKSK